MSTRHGATKWMLATVVAAALGLLSATRPVAAVDVVDDPVQMDERVTQVLQTSNALCWEVFVYHQQQPGFADSYRAAKDIWSKAGQLQDALQTGPVETAFLVQQATELNQMFTPLEKTLSKWGDGDRSSVAGNSVRELHTVVRPGVGVYLPFVGVQVGGPSVVTEVDGPQLRRLRPHPNSPGSKRSLERKMDAVKVAVSYLLEDATATSPPSSSTPATAPSETGPVPQPPKTEPTPKNQPTPIPTSTKNRESAPGANH